MDSGNSGSIQSSSGGDEEYDSSRAADSLSAFAHLSNPPQQPNYFDPNPLPNYFDPNPLPSFDPMWSKSPIYNNNSGLPLPSSSSAALYTSSSASSPAAVPLKTGDPVQPRNPKKRSRASRRAPTTVLTTDTTNFRAMVQEFTGIPAPPFTSSSSSPFVRNNRLDLFGAPSSTRSSFPLPDALQLQPPPYLLRPFAQKFQHQQPFLGPNNTNGVVSGGNPNPNSVNYQMQNQILTFQSLLQSSPMANPSVLRSGGGQDLLDMPSGNGDEVNPTVWGGGVVMNGGDQSHHLRPVNGSYVDYSQSGGKGNYEKGSENVGGGAAGRGGGMVESWLCSDH